MSIFDKVRELLGQNSGKMTKTVDERGDMFDESRTGHTDADKVDLGQEKATEKPKEYIDGQRPQSHPPA